MRNTDTCKHPGCVRAQVALGYCLACYKRLRRNGTTRKVTAEDRFFASFTESVDGCWIWGEHQWLSGYGVFVADKVRHQAHRWAYEFMRTDIPDGLVLDHLCETPLCVNPWHLEPVTQSENVRRAFHDMCPNRHPYTPENTRQVRGHRECRTCSRERVRRFQNKSRTAVA